MAVAVVMDFKDATLDQYDQVIEKMGLEPGGAGASGSLSHWAAGNEQIGPYTQEVGIPNPP
jgi:hypothetical protein